MIASRDHNSQAAAENADTQAKEVVQSGLQAEGRGADPAFGNQGMCLLVFCGMCLTEADDVQRGINGIRLVKQSVQRFPICEYLCLSFVCNLLVHSILYHFNGAPSTLYPT